MADSGEEDPEEDQSVPGKFVEQYLSMDDEVIDIIDEVRRHQLNGDQNQARRKLRNLAKSRENAFKAISYSAIGTEKFFEDVEDQMGADAASKLKKTGDQYEDLQTDFQVVNREIFANRNYPITSVRGDFASRTSEDYPMLEVSAESGSVETFSIRDRCWKLLNLSYEIAEGVEIVLSDEEEIPESEIKKVREHIDNLNGAVANIEEIIESSESHDGSESGEGSETTGET